MTDMLQACNENMLIGIVSCCKKKRSTRMPAGLLYAEPGFYKSVYYAETYCDGWIILSGKHGVLNPSDVIDPYDFDLRNRSPKYIAKWGTEVNKVLRKRFPGAGFIAMVDGPYLSALRNLDYVIKRIK